MPRKRQHNTRGPIAETYSILQGIAYIDQAFDADLAVTIAWDRLYRRTIVQCIELLLLNCTDICKQQASANPGAGISLADKCASWHLGLLQYAVELADAAVVLPAVGATAALPQGTRTQYLSSYEETAKRALSLYKAFPALLINAVSLDHSDASVSFMQTSKNIHVFMEMLLVRLDALLIHPEDTQSIDASVGGSPLNDAFAGLIPNDTDRMTLSGSSLLSQFRVLHQVPE